LPAEPEAADPGSAEARALLAAARAHYEAVLPGPLEFVLTAEELAGDGMAFFLARDGGVAVGCGALARRDGYGEVKAMWVVPAARGRGVAAALVARIERAAREAGLPVLRLETVRLLEDAVRLYRRLGFVPRGRFGAYPDSPLSLFMEKRLD
jgi:putative acetyltransferase